LPLELGGFGAKNPGLSSEYQPPRRRAQGAVFLARGFAEGAWQVLDEALRRHPVDNPIKSSAREVCVIRTRIGRVYPNLLASRADDNAVLGPNEFYLVRLIHARAWFRLGHFVSNQQARQHDVTLCVTLPSV
jgi:hypothetical protein